MQSDAKRRMVTAISYDATVVNRAGVAIGLLPSSPEGLEYDFVAFASKLRLLTSKGIAQELVECCSVAMNLLATDFEQVAEAFLQPDMREAALAEMNKFLVKYSIGAVLHLLNEELISVEDADG